MDLAKTELLVHVSSIELNLVDCGAGIGRITKHMLSHLFHKVDLVDQNQGFLDQAKIELKVCQDVDKVKEFRMYHKQETIIVVDYRNSSLLRSMT